MIFFQHDCNASEDPFISNLLDVYGHKGYAMWFLLVELYTNKCSTFGEQTVTFSMTTVRRKLRTTETIAEQFLMFCQTNGQLKFSITSTNVQLFSPNILKLIKKSVVREEIEKKIEKEEINNNREEKSKNKLEDITPSLDTLRVSKNTSLDSPTLSTLPSTLKDIPNNLKDFTFDSDGRFNDECEGSPVDYLHSLFDSKRDRVEKEFRKITDKIQTLITEKGKDHKDYSMLTYVNWMKESFKQRLL